MKKNRLFIHAMFCLLVALTGCKDDDIALDRPHHGTDKPMSAVFQLNLAFDKTAYTRALTDSTAGNGMETRLDRLHLFAVPCVELPDGSWEEDWKLATQATARLYAGWKNPIRVPIDLKRSGMMKVYVGANLNDQQAGSFIKEQAYRVEGETYYQSINEFAPFRRREESKENYYRQPENIAMFCREAATLDTESADRKVDDRTYQLGTVFLQRMVAKVLVTCQTKDNDSQEEGDVEGVKYMVLKGELADEKAKPLGWIRQENVFYFVNNMPRETPFMLRYADSEGSGQPELQAHYNLKETFTQGGLVQNYTPLEFHIDRVKEHYIHYELTDLYRYEKSFQPSLVWSEGEYKKLLASPPSGAYNEEGTGMYTLENLFELNTAESGEENAFTEQELVQLWEYKALPVITHVSIAAKLVPRSLFLTAGEWNGTDGRKPMKDEELTIGSETKKLEDWIATEQGGNTDYLTAHCPNEAVAQKVLTCSLERQGKLQEADSYDPADPDKYPGDTFFAYARPEDLGGGTVYCSYGTAASFGTVGEVDKSMIPYTNGWGYYYTYINNNEEKAITGKEQLKDACIQRNRYYILRVNSIGTLGATITDPNYMKVHTLKADWQDGGSGDITLN